MNAIAETGERGFTLVELLVYILLGVLVASVAGGLFYSSVTAQRTVQSSATIVQSTKLITASVGAGIRNSLGISIATVATTDQLLRAKTVVFTAAGATQTWECEAWYYSAATKSVYSTTSTSGLVAIPTTAQLTSGRWTLLGTGIDPLTGNTGIFSGSSSQVTISLTATAGNSSPASYSTVIVPLVVPTPAPTSSAGTLTCY